jgi:hypothetical protein
MDKRIIWLIDENENELKTYCRDLKNLMPDSVQIEGMIPLPRKEDYLSPVLENTSTATVIIDQRLKDTGIADYLGIELARFLRSVNHKLPIYILTNYPKDEEFVGSKWSVEDIIDKSSFNNDEKLATLKARILRRINVYNDVLEERERKFNQLLRKSLKEELTADELKEFSELDFHRTSTTLASEIAQLQELEEIVEKHKKLMEKFKEASDSEEADGE